MLITVCLWYSFVLIYLTLGKNMYPFTFPSDTYFYLILSLEKWKKLYFVELVLWSISIPKGSRGHDGVSKFGEKWKGF
jgi:hypothetical protein